MRIQREKPLVSPPKRLVTVGEGVPFSLRGPARRP